MLDDDDGIPTIDEAIEDAEEDADILEVQTRSRLVKDIDGLPRVALSELGGQLDTLTLSAREGRRGLPELDIAEAYILQDLKLLEDMGDVSEELHRRIDRHVEDVGDGLALEAHLEGLSIVATPVTSLAGSEDVGEEVHLDGLVAIPRAGLTASARDVEGEASRLVAAHLTLGKPHEEVTDIGEDARISRRITTGRTADRRLVYGDDLVDVLQPLDAIIGQRILQR